MSELTSPRQVILEAGADDPTRLAPGPARGRRGWVLVIAGDAALRASVAAVLVGGGYEVVTAGDSARAAAALAGRPPALTLLDLGAAGPAARPGLSGSLVLLSAGPLGELLDATEALGAAGFLRLPCVPDDLLALAERFAYPAAGQAAWPVARFRGDGTWQTA